MTVTMNINIIINHFRRGLVRGLTVAALACLATVTLFVDQDRCFATAFIVGGEINGNINLNVDSIILMRTTAGAVVEMEPEPEGGEEVPSIKTMPGSRMKNMGEATGLTVVREAEKDDDGSEPAAIYKFWLSATAEGALVKEIHQTVLKDSQRKADFPGFRKGQVPPYAMPQIRGFAVEESIVRTCQSAVDAYGLKSLSGRDGEVNVNEDVSSLAKVYKLGDDVQFTATFNAMYDPAVAKKKDVQSNEDASTTDEANDKKKEDFVEA